MNRLSAGFCIVRNPVSGAAFRVSLVAHDIGGIVFWTKNPRPMASQFSEIKRQRIPFYIQFTITPYGPPIEVSTPSVADRIETALRLTDEFGPHSVVWRYDPILISEQTPAEWHREQFSSLAARLRDVTDEVAISFVVPYKKTVCNLARALGRWTDPQLESKRALAKDLHTAATSYGISLTVCCQPDIADGLPKAACADPLRFARLGARPPDIRRTPTRPGCNCLDSRDIGEYDTCIHGCAYCYANTNDGLAQERYLQHAANGECLLPLAADASASQVQASLFAGG